MCLVYGILEGLASLERRILRSLDLDGVAGARIATAAALAEMVVSREITEPQAMTIARGYLHDNAAALYR